MTEPVHGTVHEEITVGAYHDGAALLVRLELAEMGPGTDPATADLTHGQALRLLHQLRDALYDVGVSP